MSELDLLRGNVNSISLENERLEKIAWEIRYRAFRTILNSNSGHLGGTSSSAELMTALYFGGILRVNPDNPNDPDRDRVLVRGHLGPLRYNLFSVFGWTQKDDVIENYRKLGSPYQGHESMFEVPGVDMTPSGSLGMCLSYGAGIAYATKKQGRDSRCFVFLGDGEEQEGNVSEAARHISQLGLENVICIIDKNGKQLGNRTADIDGNIDLAKIWEGYGWDVLEIQNGHSMEEILLEFKKIDEKSRNGKPILIIANTVKGFGIPGAEENSCGYHTISSCKKEDLRNSIEMISKTLDLKPGESNLEIPYLKTRQSVHPKVKTERPFEEWRDLDLKFQVCNINDSIDELLIEIIGRFKDYSSNLYISTADWLTAEDIKELKMNQEHINLINPGIKEQHLFAMMHGISGTDEKSRIILIEGDTFILRALDQLTASAQAGMPMIILGTTAGIGASKNGSTHQSVSVPGIILSTPGIEMLEPADPIDMQAALNISMKNYDKPIYIRMHNGNVTPFESVSPKEVIRNSRHYVCYDPENTPKIIMIGAGILLEGAVQLAKELDQSGFGMKVINVVNMKSLDEDFLKLLDNGLPLITVYNGNPETLQMAVSRAVSEYGKEGRIIKSHGFEIGTSGSLTELLEYFRFDKEGLKKVLKEKFPDFNL